MKPSIEPRTFLALPAMFLTAALAVLAACAPTGDETTTAAAASGDVADLVLVGGTIRTLEADRPTVEALAARGGRIVALGARAEVEALIGDETEVIDLGGALAIPGFIESHGHFLGIGDAKIQLDLRAARSWREIVDQVSAAVAEAEPGAWIRGRGWHQDKWDASPDPSVEGFPIHDSLSAVSPDHPVMLTHASGHASFVNARALELAGIGDATPNPPGGEILRDGAGRATGLLRETAAGLVGRARAADDAAAVAETQRMIELASEECLRNGLTSFQDAGSSFAEIDQLIAAANDGRLGPRLWVMVRDSNEALRARLADVANKEYGAGMLEVGGIKLSIDGALGSRGAWLLEPYSDAPHTSGLNLIPLDYARETAEIAIASDVQLCIHAIGDRANREVLDLFQQTFAAHPDEDDLRWRVEHAQHLHPDDVPRFAELGVIASVQGIHCTSDGPWVPDRIGDERAEAGAYVWRDLIDSGAVVINGTDAPVEPVSPIASYYASVSRVLPDGTRFYSDQRMSREEALATYTKDAAWAVFQEDEKGTLAVGKLADVTVLSQDVVEVPEERIPETEVLYTIVGGEVLYRAR